MDGIQYIVGKYGAIFTDGLVLNPSSIVQYNGARWGGDRDNMSISLIVKEKNSNKTNSVCSQYPDEYESMKKSGILLPVKTVLTPHKEASFQVGDIVLWSDDPYIINKTAYDYIENTWMYILSEVAVVSIDENNSRLKLRNGDHTFDGYIEESWLEALEEREAQYAKSYSAYKITYKKYY